MSRWNYQNRSRSASEGKGNVEVQPWRNKHADTSVSKEWQSKAVHESQRIWWPRSVMGKKTHKILEYKENNDS